jgi:hypothetical protein
MDFVDQILPQRPAHRRTIRRRKRRLFDATLSAMDAGSAARGARTGKDLPRCDEKGPICGRSHVISVT